MIKVLFISHGPMLYGAQRSLLTLLVSINRDLVTPYLLVPRDGPLTDEARKLDIPVIILPLNHWVAFGQVAKESYSKRAAKVLNGLKGRVDAIAAVIKKHDIDLVYTNTVTCMEGALAASATKRRHVWHLREHVAGNKDLKPLLPPSIISYIVGALSDHVIVNSRALAQAYSCSNLNNKVSVVYNGINLNSFQVTQGMGAAFRDELGVGSNTKIIATIGSITPRKGHSIFIDAASKLKDSFDEVVFVVIGDGEKKLVRELTIKARKAGLENVCHFVGWRNDIVNILAGIDLLVVSAEQEAFGRTIVEAMAAGVPVVATRCGGPEEIVVDGVTGFLVPVNRPEELAIAVARILSNNDLASNFSIAGRARAKELFSEDAYVMNVESIIARLADPINPINEAIYAKQLTTKATTRLIAFYLPQYHPIPENDEWWCKGFTEWTNAAKAEPLFHGHYQPHAPADLGFYDLRVPETRAAQAEMAREHGIEAFCYYHYWFGGKRLLERPFNEVLESGKPDFPFCLCWANATWTGIWHGNPGRILMEQSYPGAEDYEAHFRELLPAFRDERYLKVDGKPLFIIYKPKDVPNVQEVAEYFRKMAERAGLPGLYLVGVSHHDGWEPKGNGFDAAVVQNLPGLTGKIPWRYPLLKLRSWLRRGRLTIYEYKDLLRSFVPDKTRQLEYLPCLIPSWDNTPRSGINGLIMRGSTPELFQRSVRQALDNVADKPLEHRLVFLKSWNEWAEGNHMEPDLRYGYAYLEALHNEIVMTGVAK